MLLRHLIQDTLADRIIEASRRSMVDKYDLVVTSGGIGPTHDGTYNPSMPLIDLDNHVLRIGRQVL